MRLKALFARSGQEWLSSLPVTLLLLAVVIFGTGELIHSQLLSLGNHFWDGYHELRQDTPAPTCNRNMDIESELQRMLAEQETESDDDFDLFEEEPLDPDAARASLLSAQSACQAQFESYESRQERITPNLERYRSMEIGISKLSDISLTSGRYIMMLLLVICAITATLVRDHIALRPMRTMRDHTVSTAAQLVGNTFIFIGALFYREEQLGAGIALNTMQNVTQWVWIIGFGLLSLLSLWQLARVRFVEVEGQGNYLKALLSIPLYTYMAIISGVLFFFNDHYSGIIIYLGKMLDLNSIFIQLGLYVWIGMLLKQTQLASLVFDTFRPWKFPPEILAFVALIVSAFPTAYTGGSAIYVIAAGSVIYAELRRAGARRQLALATTAMSGSLGIVLKPCLMIVVIAALNKEVITSAKDDSIGIFDFGQMSEWGLFDAGYWVFFLSTFLFMVISLATGRPEIKIASPREAVPAMLKLMMPLVPYIITIAAIVCGYYFLLDAKVDEFSATIILPAVLLAVVLYDQFYRRKSVSKNYSIMKGFEHGVRNATNETTAHIGALLMLMGMSIAVGGVLENSGGGGGLGLTAPESIWGTMAMLVCMLVAIGMFMDPMGAIILVTLTLAKFAYNNGVDPLHFWMVTLVAFELGYLTPPVALNHLMTRHVVGEQEFDIAAEEAKDQTFYQRHERILLPIVVMFITLMIVAFGPLFFYS